jgi:hypothetical protein
VNTRETRPCKHCGKATFATWWEAEKRALKARARGERVAAYKCPHTKHGAWHWGHHSGKERKLRAREQ